MSIAFAIYYVYNDMSEFVSGRKCTAATDFTKTPAIARKKKNKRIQ